MDIQDLRTLLDYHYWARDRLLEAIEPLTPDQFNRGMGGSFASIRETVVHIYGAERVWHARWQGAAPTALPSSEPFPDVMAIRRAWSAHEAEMRAFLEQLGDAGVRTVLSYTLSSGKAGSSPFWQMLQHVVNHASYHRGQVTTMLRQLGVPPGQSMDMIAFYRQPGSGIRDQVRG